MNLQTDPQQLATLKFAIGQPVPRSEDPVLVRGLGSYTDDMKLPGEAYAAMVRSRVAHGIIKRIDTSSTRQFWGHLRALTSPDTAASNASFRSITATARP
jgi:aerobic carbon-monoxide dehydrogenase large subunit